MTRKSASIYVTLHDTPLSVTDLLEMFTEATYVATHNGYRVGRTMFLLSPFTLSDEADA